MKLSQSHFGRQGALAIAIFVLQGCAGVGVHDRNTVPAQIAALRPILPVTPVLAWPSDADNALPNTRSCLAWYEKIDTAVDAAGVRDGGAHRLAGFPHLRIDRFVASFGDQQRENLNTLPAMLGYARDLDLAAREHELANLPQRWQAVLGISDIAATRAVLNHCSQALLRRDLASPDLQNVLSAQWQVPDHYAVWKRTLGLYPLTSIPIFSGIKKWQQATESIFAANANSDTNELTPTENRSRFSRYQPNSESEHADISERGGTPAIETIFASRSRNRLGVPQLNDADWRALISRHAPIFLLESNGTFDRIGTIVFARDSQVTVDAASPVVYQRVSFTRIAGQTYVQLTYSVWFSERPVNAPMDLLGGNLDGVMVRITLGQNGTPLLVDSIHACGCYHLFFPTPNLSPRPPPDTNIEWAFSPKNLPAMTAGQRVVVQLASATHYLTDIRIDNGDSSHGGSNNPSVAHATYRLNPERDLLSLPLSQNDANGERKSIYEPSGLIAGSTRGERFVFWPMGILSPGAMRQWGTHATAFVGIRHFDDADLIDQRYAIVKVR